MQLTKGAAREIGTAFRFFRHARGDTLRDAAQRAGLSYQYAHNIESGARLNVTDEKFHALARAYGVSDRIVDNLILRARISTALETWGVAVADIDRAWEGVVVVMATIGHEVSVDLAGAVASLLAEKRSA